MVFSWLRLLMVLLVLCCGTIVSAQQQPVNVIFDTDMGPDYDDVGAITILHALADSGKANILATIASTKYEGVAAVLDVLNTYFKRPDIPVAVPRGKALETKDFQHWSDTLIARYPHSIRKNEETPDAVELYRKILSKQPDSSVNHHYGRFSYQYRQPSSGPGPINIPVLPASSW